MYSAKNAAQEYKPTAFIEKIVKGLFRKKQIGKQVNAFAEIAENT